MIRRVYAGHPVEVMAIPDIESVNYGRGVGYEVNCFSPPLDIETISTSSIRACIQNNDESWEKHVDEEIHQNIS